MHPKAIDDADLDKLTTGATHSANVLACLKKIDNPSEMLTHVVAQLVPGKWCCSIPGPNIEVAKSCIQVHLKNAGAFYVTNVSKAGEEVAAVYSCKVNGQMGCQFSWGEDVMAAWTLC